MNYVSLKIAAFCMLLWGLACAGYGLLVLTHAQSAIHEIEAGVALTIATISIGFAFVIGSRLEMNSRDHPSRKLLWFVLTGLLVTAGVVSVLWRPLGKGVEPLTQPDKGVPKMESKQESPPPVKRHDDEFFDFAIGYAEAKLYATDICSKSYQFNGGDRRTFTASSAYGSLGACISALIVYATENEHSWCKGACYIPDAIKCQEQRQDLCKSQMGWEMMLAEIHKHPLVQQHKGRYKGR